MMNSDKPMVSNEELDVRENHTPNTGASRIQSALGWLAVAGPTGIVLLLALMARAPEPPRPTTEDGNITHLAGLGCDVVSDPKGARVTHVDRPATPAAIRGIEVNDLLFSLDGRMISDVDDLSRRLDDAKGPVKLEVVDGRNGSHETFVVDTGQGGGR
jgi:predicted metalloprotease with PDZ domain